MHGYSLIFRRGQIWSPDSAQICASQRPLDIETPIHESMSGSPPTLCDGPLFLSALSEEDNSCDRKVGRGNTTGQGSQDWGVDETGLFLRLLLLLFTLFLGLIALRAFVAPQNVHAQSAETCDFYIQPARTRPLMSCRAIRHLNNPLPHTRNCILSPRIGWPTKEARR